MYIKAINFLGILLSTVGTVFTLYNVLSTNPKDIGTHGYYKKAGDDFKKQKSKTIKGCILIVIGGFLQILALLMSPV